MSEAPKPWRLRLSCCGRDEGVQRFATGIEADGYRDGYITGPGVAEHGYSSHAGEPGHRRAAIKEYAPEDSPAYVVSALSRAKGLAHEIKLLATAHCAEPHSCSDDTHDEGFMMTNEAHQQMCKVAEIWSIASELLALPEPAPVREEHQHRFITDEDGCIWPCICGAVYSSEPRS